MRFRSALTLLVGSLAFGCSSEEGTTTPGVAPDTGTATTDTGSPGTDTRVDPADTASVEDSLVADSGAADTGAADSGAADSSAVGDSSDSGSADTSLADTSVADSTTTDSAAADTASSDIGTDTGASDGGVDKTQVVWVLRLGDGTAVATGVSAPLFLTPITIKYSGSTGAGTVGTAVTIPSTGASAISLPISSSIGSLSRSSNGKLVSFAAYKAAAATADIVNSAPSAIKRAAVAINAAGTISSTELGADANGNGSSLRGAVTTDGAVFWTSSEDKGIGYTAAAGTTTSLTTGNLRWPLIAGGQLYVTTGSTSGTPGRGLLQVGTGLPTAATTLVVAPGTGVSGTGNASPYGALAFDTDATTGIDTAYVCDDRATAAGGGVQRWKLESGTWVLKATHGGDFSGCRGLTGWVDGGNVYLVATTTEATARAVLMVDTVAGVPAITTATTLATAATNATFRGVALAPNP